METAHLHEFAKVADCGSFTAAARELHLTQSTLSKHVALLEREFGADLFVRDRSGVSLTEAGGGLDRRELGALILYVEEHGFETIQDELALTRDEVADVLGSVYRKLGVGDKQEALDFIHSVSE